jgi:hypothetical protein
MYLFYPANGFNRCKIIAEAGGGKKNLFPAHHHFIGNKPFIRGVYREGKK